MSELRTNSIVPKNGIPAGAAGGGIIQVMTANLTATQDIGSGSVTAGNEYDITNLSLTITPAKATNKILVMGHISHYVKDNQQAHFYVKRGSTIVARGDADGARFRTLVTAQGNNDYYSDWVVKNTPFFWLDSPATTSATVYKVVCVPGVTGSSFIYINRGERDQEGTNYDARATSNFTIMEVCA